MYTLCSHRASNSCMFQDPTLAAWRRSPLDAANRRFGMSDEAVLRLVQSYQLFSFARPVRFIRSKTPSWSQANLNGPLPAIVVTQGGDPSAIPSFSFSLPKHNLWNYVLHTPTAARQLGRHLTCSRPGRVEPREPNATHGKPGQRIEFPAMEAPGPVVFMLPRLGTVNVVHACTLVPASGNEASKTSK